MKKWDNNFIFWRALLLAIVIAALITHPSFASSGNHALCFSSYPEILDFISNEDAGLPTKSPSTPAITKLHENETRKYDFIGQHSKFTKNLQETAIWMDHFFGNDRVEESTASSELRLSWSNSFQESTTPNSRLRLRGKLYLPHMQKKLQLVFEGEPDKKDISGLDNENSTSALRYSLVESALKSINLDLGFRGGFSDPRLFIRLWSRKTLIHDKRKLHRISPALSYDTRLGWETYLRYDTEYKPRKKIFLRTTTKPGWSEDKDGFTFEQNFTLYKQISAHKLIAMDWLNSAVIYPYSDVVSRIRIRHRRAIWMDKLFLEFAPGLQFASENDFNPDWQAYITLEILFSPDKLHPPLQKAQPPV